MSEYKLVKGLLPNPIKNLASLGGNVLDSFVSGDQSVNPGSNNWYVLCLTPDELQDFKNIINIGAPIVYPETYNTYWQKWWQLLQFPNQIPEDSCMDLCQLIIECIEQTPELQQTIAQYSNTLQPDADALQQDSIGNTDLFGGQSVGCNNDKIFAMTTGLVDLLNQVVTDILEVINTGTNNSSTIGDLIEAIPGIGLLPYDDILQFIDKVADNLAAAYAGAYDSQIRDDLRCGLFCIATNDCELTIYDVRDYMQARVGASVQNTNLVSVVNDIIANNFIGELSIYMFNWFVLDAIIFGGEVLGIDVNRLLIQIAALWNDSDSDWSILCTNCGWTYTRLGGENIDPVSDGWVADFGDYNATDDLYDGENQSDTNSVKLVWTFDGIYALTEIFFIWTVEQIASSRNQVIRVRDEFNAIQFEEIVSVDSTPNFKTGSISLSATINTDVDWTLELVTNAADVIPGDGYSQLESIIIGGTGTNPFS